MLNCFRQTKECVCVSYHRYNTRICGWILTQILVPVTIMGDGWGNDVMSRVITTHHALRWRHNGHDSVSNHQPYDCLLNRLFRNRPKKTSKLRVTALCVGNSPETGEFPAQMASNAENVSILLTSSSDYKVELTYFLCLGWYSIESITYEPLHKSTQYR